MSKKLIEDVINETLEGEARANALDFITYLRANEIEIPINEPDNYFWDATNKGEGMCVINIQILDDGVSFDTFIQKLPASWETGEDIDERTKEIVWANIRPCDPTCGGSCSPGSPATVCGKEFDGLCTSRLGFYAPNAETVACMKEIIAAKISM